MHVIPEFYHFPDQHQPTSYINSLFIHHQEINKGVKSREKRNSIRDVACFNERIYMQT
jgi:hypothetical protein